MPGFVYNHPRVNVTSSAPQSIAPSASNARTMMVVGSAPSGPDTLCLISADQAAQIYGDPSNSKSSGFTLPSALQLAASQSQPSRVNRPLQFLVARMGVTRGKIILADASGATLMTLYGIGMYSGNASKNLRVTVYNSKPGSPAAAFTRLKIEDTNNFNGYMQLDYSIASNPGITTVLELANLINGDNPIDNPASVIYADVPSSTTSSTLSPIGNATTHAVATTATVVSNSGRMSTGVDGGGVLMTPGTQQSTTELASLADALTKSLIYDVDAINVQADAASILTTIATHLTTEAVAANKYRVAILGPAIAIVGGTSTGNTGLYGNLAGPTLDDGGTPAIIDLSLLNSGSYASTYMATASYASAVTSKVVVVGHDACYAPDFITGRVIKRHGYQLAAAYAGLKLCGPPEETCMGMAINGIIDIAPPPDKNRALTDAELDNLANYGYTTFARSRGSASLLVRDTVTTAPFLFNSQINPFSQLNVQDIDNAVNRALVNAMQPYLGQPYSDQASTSKHLQDAARHAINSLGHTTNGIKSLSSSFDVNRLVPSINLVYITRYPIMEIDINTSVALT